MLLLAVIGYTLIDRFEDSELPADTVTTTA